MMKDLTNLSKLKIYTIDYLTDTELTDQDISNLLDNGHLGLTISLIVGMFKHSNSKKRNSQILKDITKDSLWMKGNSWTKEQHDSYEVLVTKVYKNVFQFRGLQARSMAQWFMTMYGLSVNGNFIDLSK